MDDEECLQKLNRYVKTIYIGDGMLVAKMLDKSYACLDPRTGKPFRNFKERRLAEAFANGYERKKDKIFGIPADEVAAFEEGYRITLDYVIQCMDFYRDAEVKECDGMWCVTAHGGAIIEKKYKTKSEADAHLKGFIIIDTIADSLQEYKNREDANAFINGVQSALNIGVNHFHPSAQEYWGNFEKGMKSVAPDVFEEDETEENSDNRS